jgi:tRNA-Thr(GGU) m(6)t(6)A37 methyltransferase TsaA
MMMAYQIFPIGVVHNREEGVWIEIYPKYVDGVLGLDQFSHIHVLYWFHENDTPDKRGTLQVHPRGNEQNPLTGVFATHSPARPNLIALTRCKFLSLEGNRIMIDAIDARDGSPVIDIKSYFPFSETETDVTTPNWAGHVESSSPNP